MYLPKIKSFKFTFCELIARSFEVLLELNEPKLQMRIVACLTIIPSLK